jgi:peroxiredoxin
MSTAKLKLGSVIPQFNLPSIDGNNYSVNSFDNKDILIVVFSCNHCPYVQAYEKRLIAIQDKYKDNVAIVAINSNDDIGYPEDSFEEMKKRATKMGFNFQYLRDESQEVAKSFDATHTPEIFMFDKNRKLIFHGKIDDNWQNENLVKTKYLENAINEYLNGEEISIPETFTIGCTIKWK